MKSLLLLSLALAAALPRGSAIAGPNTHLRIHVGHQTKVGVWENCTGGKQCAWASVCIQHSVSFSQCKPETLPAGELCGQDDGTNVWTYDHCPAGQACHSTDGTDKRCK